MTLPEKPDPEKDERRDAWSDLGFPGGKADRSGGYRRRMGLDIMILGAILLYVGFGRSDNEVVGYLGVFLLAGGALSLLRRWRKDRK